jgi:NAD-dependent SIR2 family protein deacetylase
VAAALAALDAADALLVAGSSLAVYSGYRFCVHAHGTGKPIVVINQGSTRADALATLRVDAECGGALQALATHAGTPATATASAIVDS